MRVFRHLDEISADWAATVISIGNFDGVHRGHQQVLQRVVERARASGRKSMAVTFDPHPLRVLRPDSAPLLITPLDEKLAALRKTEIDAALVIAFDKQFSTTSPRDFAKEIIAEKLRAKEVHEGANFHFGHRAEGDCTKLKQFGKEFGFEVFVYPEMRLRGEPVSSSRIRQLLTGGSSAWTARLDSKR